GEAAAATAFADLLFMPQARSLIRLFFARTAARKNPWAAAAKPVARVAVVGAGLMGAGIAEVSAAAGLSVRIKDVTLELAQAGRDRAATALAARGGKGMTLEGADAAAERVVPVADYAALAEAEVTIEAVLEDLELKRAVLAQVENVTAPGHLYASNTSALRIADLAAAAERPEAVVGMHYFSPVAKMELLEVVVTRHTAEWAVATATAVGLRQGKSVIVVLDGPGFYTTRVLSVFLAEAVMALREGVAPAVLESAMVTAGFPLGPLALLDDVGIDTGAKIEAVLEPLLMERGYVVPGGTAGGVSARLAKAGFLGRKAHKGFYIYEGESRTREFDVRAFLAAGLPLPLDGQGAWPSAQLKERLLLTFAREAMLCLEEGVLGSARDGDVGAVLGLGFPAYLGGPFAMLDGLGLKEALARFEALRDEHGERFSPPAMLVDMAAADKLFYPVSRAAS
ncbi:MAG TPA: 3-hydroxyacyl-CoA dehydrogenase NAD-binding domain-containing protein, partial [Trueperaceae bacterium]|nr:3-hydroxyacyl-CoA dehydrogenase NAD-binding domain-containing protein [Trueperaceae bacterium]